MTKSARSRFSASGIWRARIACELLLASCRAGPARAARWTSAGAVTTTTLSTRPRRRSRTAAGCRARRVARLAPRLSARKASASARTSGWTIASSACKRRRVAEHRRPTSRSRSTDAVVRSSRETPPRSAAAAAPDRAGAPPRRNRAPARRRRRTSAVVDLPMPIEPVRPSTIIAQRSDVGDDHARAARRVTSGRTPNQRSKPGTAWCSSMPRPSTVSQPARSRCRQQRRLQRHIDDVGDDAPSRAAGRDRRRALPCPPCRARSC